MGEQNQPLSQYNLEEMSTIKNSFEALNLMDSKPDEMWDVVKVVKHEFMGKTAKDEETDQVKLGVKTQGGCCQEEKVKLNKTKIS